MFMRRISLYFVLALSASDALQARLVPEFGDSVEFEKGRELKMSNLRGKVALVFFMQSWCGMCNGWSGELFKQVTEKHGDNPKVVLVALKSDGGTVETAKSYLRERKVDLSKWFVGVDKGEAYYKKIIPQTPLFGYMGVDPEGNVVLTDKAGMFRSQGDKKIFVAGTHNIDKEFGGTRARLILDPGLKLEGKLAEVRRLAEAGCTVQALIECQKLAADPSLKAEAAEVQALLLKSVESQLESLETAAADTSAASKERYRAFAQLRSMVLSLQGSPLAQTYAAKIRKLDSDAALRKEAQAETAYKNMENQVKNIKQDAQRQQSWIAGLKSFITHFKDTLYGEIAQAELKALGQ